MRHVTERINDAPKRIGRRRQMPSGHLLAAPAPNLRGSSCLKTPSGWRKRFAAHRMSARRGCKFLHLPKALVERRKAVRAPAT